MYPWSAGNKAASRNGAGHEELDIWIQNLIQRKRQAKLRAIERSQIYWRRPYQTKTGGAQNPLMSRCGGTNTLRTRVRCYRRRYFLLGNIPALPDRWNREITLPG